MMRAVSFVMIALVAMPSAVVASEPLHLSLQAEVNPSSKPESASNTDEISEKLANPISNLISLPFQFNYDRNTGQGNGGDRLTLNIQPVIPIQINDDLLLITRTIVPLVYQSNVIPDGGDTQYGVGDISESLFFSPTHSGIAHVTWGVGPELLLPAGTNDSLGTGKWAAGPAAIVLYQNFPWTTGLLYNHLWSYAGDGDRAYVNQSFFQPFLSYQFGHGLSATTQLEATYDYRAEQWTIPWSTGVSQVVPIGKMPVSFGLQGRYWLEGPDGAPEWGIRAVVTFVFPK